MASQRGLFIGERPSRGRKMEMSDAARTRALWERMEGSQPGTTAATALGEDE
jgi:hypothetical protein